MQDKKQDKKPLNAEGQPHGFWEVYHSNGKLFFKGLYLNNLREGFWESYWSNGNLYYKGNYIKGELIGYNQWNYSDWSIQEIRFYAR